MFGHIVAIFSAVLLISACSSRDHGGASINSQPVVTSKAMPGFSADRKIATYPMPKPVASSGLDRDINEEEAVAIAREVGGTAGELLERPRIATFEQIKREYNFISYDFALDEMAYVIKVRGYGGRLAALNNERAKPQYTKMTIVVSQRGGKPIGGLAEK